MNSKKISIILLTVSLFAILFGNVAIAENCPNLVGNWEVTGKEVCGIRATEEFEYRPLDATLEITNQDGCLFYGYLRSLYGDGLITGLIVRRKITMTVWDVTITGRLLLNNKMILTFSDLADDENTEQCTGSGIAEKIQDL